MNIIEVKNNLVKICYEDDLTQSGFVQINDTHKSYIAQVLHLESTRVGKFAVAKIVFNFNNGITAYDGTIPSLRAEVKSFDSKILLDSLTQSDPLIIGKLAGQDDNIVVDMEMLKDNPIIIAEKFHITKTLIGNFALQLQARNSKLVVFDTTGVFNYGKFSLIKDFKLPLNESGINYIYEKEFSDATEESKALIQSIFDELSEYSKTVEYIPFDTFKSVVDSQFAQTKLIQLVIMKNRIKQIKDLNVFAQDKSEFGALKEKLESDNIVIVDISKVKDALKYEAIKYVYSILEKIGSEFYAFTPVSTESADSVLLNRIRETQNVHTTIICDYDYANLDDLKRNSKNMLMFTPLKQQHDFGGYNMFMQRLAEDEFISYGKMTKFVPLIGKIEQIDPKDIVIPEPVVETVPEPIPEPVFEVVSEAETEPVGEPVDNSEVKEEVPVQEEIKDVEVEPQQEVVQEPQQDVVEEQAQEPAQEPTEDEEVVTREEAVIEEVEPKPVEEVSAPEIQTIEKPEVDITEMAKSSAESVQTVIEPAQEIVQEPVNDVQEALNQVPDMVEDEELSDDDLDMIEELSKPNEDIPVINEEQPAVEETSQVTQSSIEEPIAQEVVVEPEPQPAVESVENVGVQEEVVEPVEEITETPQPVAEEVVQEVPVQEELPQEEIAQSVSQPTEDVIEEEPVPREESVNDEEHQAQIPQQTEPLQTRAKTTPSVPEYSADIPEEDKVNSDPLQQGDRVFHQEFGEGVVEKLINYGDKVLCSINFASVGRRLLNPEITEMRKI